MLQSRKWQLISKSQWCCGAMLPIHCPRKRTLDPRLQPASTPPLQSITPGLHPISIQQTAPPWARCRTSDCCLLLIYRSREDERLSWPSWLTCSGCFSHISGHPSAAGRAQDRESSPAKDRRYTTVPRNQPKLVITSFITSYANLTECRMGDDPLALRSWGMLRHSATHCDRMQWSFR